MIYNIVRRTLGLNFTGSEKSEFLLWSPLAGKIELIVNGHTALPAAKQKFGYWFLQTGSINPGDYYIIRIDGKKELPDPASLAQPEGVHGPSMAVDLNSFRWEDNFWKGQVEESIFYELHTGTFSVEGTFDAIARRIPYFMELGINTLELMPVAQFPGERNWGYDGVLPYAVQYSYGGPSGLQRLVNECHKNGLAVVLDVVYNHMGPEGNYFSEFGPYFTDNYRTPWGQAINFDNKWSDGVRHYFVENMLMWLRDFHLDGLRLDAVHAIKDFSVRHLMIELRQNADALEKVTGRRYLLIAENDLNDPRFINPYEKGGYGLDKQWCDEFHHSLHSLLTGERNGYYSDFGEISQLVKSFNSAYVYDGVWSDHRKMTFGASTAGIDGSRFVVFTQNHDHIGNRMFGDRLGSLVDYEKLKLAAGTMFISPFVPLIFMGEEYNEKNPFQYFISHTDAELALLVSIGRKKEFPDFMTGDEFPEPLSDSVFKNSTLTFDLSGGRDRILEFYRELIRLKKHHPVWKSYDRTNFRAEEICRKGVLISKKEGDNSLTAILNFGAGEIIIPLSQGQKKQSNVLINSALKKWGGTLDNFSLAGKSQLEVPSFSFIVISDVS